jgi:hypothetical protein
VPAKCSPTIIAKTSGLSRRADSLRGQADGLRPFLAQAYRRRASELELEAWAIKARSCEAEPIAA